MENQTMTPSTVTRSELTDRLFDRLASMYGKAWFDCWADVPMAAVKEAWTKGLAQFSAYRIKGGLEAALVTLKFPPSLPEFAILCRDAPPDPILSAPRPVPLLGHASPWIDPLLDSEKRRDNRDWARRILARKNSGEALHGVAEQFAREALEAPGARK